MSFVLYIIKHRLHVWSHLAADGVPRPPGPSVLPLLGPTHVVEETELGTQQQSVIIRRWELSN